MSEVDNPLLEKLGDARRYMLLSKMARLNGGNTLRCMAALLGLLRMMGEDELAAELEAAIFPMGEAVTIDRMVKEIHIPPDESEQMQINDAYQYLMDHPYAGDYITELQTKLAKPPKDGGRKGGNQKERVEINFKTPRSPYRVRGN